MRSRERKDGGVWSSRRRASDLERGKMAESGAPGGELEIQRERKMAESGAPGGEREIWRRA